MKIIDYPIYKPVASMSKNGRVFVNIREDVLVKAARQGAKLRVWGDKVIDPNEWLKVADRRKQVFRRPDEPMVLRGWYIGTTEIKNQTLL